MAKSEKKTTANLNNVYLVGITRGYFNIKKRVLWLNNDMNNNALKLNLNVLEK